MKVLVFTKLNKQQKTLLIEGLAKPNQYFFKDDLADDQLLHVLDEAEIVLGNIPVNYLNKAPANLKFWQLDSAGFDQYKDVSLPIPISNMGNFYAQRCAETIVSGLIAFYRGIHTLVKLQQDQNWVGAKIRKDLHAIAGKKIVILGAGAIALAAKEMLKGFGCSIKLVARKNPIAEIHDFKTLLEILPATDAVINTLPGSAENYVNKDFINAMKKDSVYANVGRGNTTDEQALITALENNKLAGAILDVTETEPLPTESKLWAMENVILTQHSAGGDEFEVEGKIKHFIKNVNKFQTNEQLEDLIDLKEGY